jgi:hypothetical protein
MDKKLCKMQGTYIKILQNYLSAPNRDDNDSKFLFKLGVMQEYA